MFDEFDTIRVLLPECILVLLATCIYVGGAFARGRAAWTLAAAVGFAAALAIDMWVLLSDDRALWGALFEELRQVAMGPLAIDCLGSAVRWLAMLVGLLLTLMSWRTCSRELASEYLGTLVLVIVGVMLTARANDLVLLFLGLELVSIPTYVLLFLGRRGRGASEATVKYFFLSIFSSALLLYGFNFLYGLGGVTTIVGEGGIREALERLQDAGALQLQWIAPLALVLIFAGLGFKIAAVPFHFYAPDVYQGTSNANAGLLAVAPKIAGIVALIRLVVVAMPPSAPFAWRLAMVVAMLTMTLGNVCALWQRNIRRLLAYSSIAHAGYMLIGLAVAVAAASASGFEQGDVENGGLGYGVEFVGVGYGGVAAMLLYLFVYVLAALGTFSALTYLGSEEREVNDVDELAGLARVQPLAAAAIGVFMFSLAGIPPLAGFWGKLTLLSGAVKLATANLDLSYCFGVLAVVGAMNAAVAAAYYLRIVAAMYFSDADSSLPVRGGWSAGAATAACALLVVMVGVMPATVVQTASQAEQSVQLGGTEAASLSTLKLSDDRLAERSATLTAAAQDEPR